VNTKHKEFFQAVAALCDKYGASISGDEDSSTVRFKDQKDDAYYSDVYWDDGFASLHQRMNAGGMWGNPTHASFTAATQSAATANPPNRK
jgi:hypothetical protein